MAFISPLTSGTRSSFTTVIATSPLSTPHNRRPAPYRAPPPRPQPLLSLAEPGNTRVDANKTDTAPAAREARVQLWREVEALKQSLKIAVNAERFADAARLRDQIESLSLADDYFRTETELKAAVAEQRFADAARLRDVLKLLEPPPPMAALRGEQAQAGAAELTSSPMSELEPDKVESWSKTETLGIVVHVESYYMPEQSLPEQNRFLFGYKVSITNQGADTCQLVSRHWVIDSAGSPESEVKGPGVVGRQPVLEPGESFEYTSACPITVPLQAGQSVVGNMRGQFHFCKGDTGNIRFSVDIDPFYFKLPFKNYRPSGPSRPGVPWIKP